MGELVELDVTTVEESVTVNVTEEGQVQISVVAETGPAGPAGPNSVTSATTSDGTCDLSLDTLTVGLSTVSGVRSVAIGQSTASGALSFASGASTASDDYCFANGDNSTASGYASTASGTGCTASGYASDASGDGTVSSGYASIASGSVSEATGDYSIALGRRAKAIHDGASVEADSQNADVESTTTDEKTFRFANGYRFLGGAVTIDDTLNCDHIHGNLAGSVYAHIRAGENLAKGDPVYVSGSHGSGATLIPVVSKADASNAAKMPAVGVMDAAVSNNQNGHMVITGTITELDTNAYAVNTVLYVATGGGWTSTPPAANSQAVAIVERSNTNNGAVIVKVNGLGSSGGNGAADANKLVRYDSAGSFAIPGPYETDADAAYAGVPLDHLYYQPSGAVAASVDIPSLDLAFATDKSLTARFGPTPTFARGSTGTFVGSNGLIQSAAINIPRFDHNPTTLASLGLLIEESRINLLNGSQTFATSGGVQNNWVDTNITRDGTLLTSPDGTSNALRITASAANGTVISSAAAGSSAARVFSIFLRRVTGTGNIQYTLDNGSTWTTQAITSSWVRYTFAATTANQQVGIRIVTSGDAIEIWGAQLEAGSFPTSYIPTTTTALTRSADVCSITGADFTSFYNQSEGTVFVSGAVTSNDSLPVPFQSSDGTNANRVRIGMTNVANEAVRPFISAGSVSTYSSFFGTSVINVNRKIATAYNNNDAISAFNGTLGLQDTTVTVPIVMNVATIGFTYNGHISRIQYFKKRLANSKLQSLTT